MPARKDTGITLVTGGTGFIGSHVVEALLQESDHGQIHVVSRNPKSLFQDRVQYHSVDIGNASDVDKKLREIQPSVIFHVASPRDTEQLSYAAYRKTNVTGTLNLLSSATQIPAIKAFVFTSSSGVIGGHPVIDADERFLTCDTPGFKPNFYHRTKAEAEHEILETDQSKLLTVSLRLCLSYGERDNQFLPSMMDTYRNNQTNIQLGNNTVPYDFLYAGNAAKAHILAAKALLYPDQAHGKVAGESFLITDGQPRKFWDAAHIIWRAAGDKTRYEDNIVIPAWFALLMARVIEWACLIFTLGRVTPVRLNTHSITHAVQQHTYKIDKARRRLGYDPVPDFEGGFQRAVAVYLDENQELSKDA